MNMIKSSNARKSKSKKIFKNFLCPFSITINIKIVNMITIVNIIKAVFYNEMLVVINDPLLLLTLT